MEHLPDKAIENRSITRRLAATLVATVLIVSAVAVAAMHYVVSQAATKALEQRADETLAYLVGTLSVPLWTVDDDGIKTIGLASSRDESIVRLIIRNRSGAEIYSIDKQEGGGRINRSAPIFHKQGNQEIQAGEVAVSLTQTINKESNRQLLFFSTSIIFLILISVVLVAVIFIRISLRKPLNSLNEIANRFAAGAYDPSGHVVPYVEFQPFGTALDQMASKIKGQIGMIREAEARYRNIFENALEGIYQTSLEGRFLHANPAMAKILGYDSLGELEASTLNIPHQIYLHSEDRDKVLALLLEQGAVTRYEIQFHRRDGQIIWVSTNARMVRDEANLPLFIEGFLTDISEHKRAEEEIHKLNQELEQRVSDRTAQLELANKELEAFAYAAEAANQAKSTFLANMSHELRTPLNGILGYAQILLRDKTLSERESSGLNLIQKSGEHLLTLINDILDFAKIEAGKLELYVTDIQFHTFLRVITGMIEVKAAQKDLDFGCDLAPDLPAWVRADEKRLRQVLLNLLSNAVKFTDRGSVRLAVSSPAPGRFRFDVQDSGVGIGADQLEAIFKPFEQAGDLQHRIGGTGLGLAISRQFLKLMGSDVQVQSRVGEGSTFWFEVDLQVIASKGGVAHEPGPMGYAGMRKRILVVDDVADNRAVAIDMLSQLGFETGAAVSGMDALEKAQALRPDLILMDLVMPGMDGLETTRRLRQLPDFEVAPIIMLSASASVSDQEQSRQAGANAFLVKPIEYERLMAQIGRLLRLDLTYEPTQGLPVSGDGGAGAFTLPPQHEIDDLYQLARLGNMQDILHWADHLDDLDERYHPFTNQLRLLAKGYQSKAILNLAKYCLNSSESIFK